MQFEHRHRIWVLISMMFFLSIGPTGRSFLDGRTVVCNDVLTSPTSKLWRERALKMGYRSSGAFPIWCGKRVIGNLNVYAASDNYFDEAESALVEEVATDVSFAFTRFEEEETRQRMEEELRTSSTRYKLLFENSPVPLWEEDFEGVTLFFEALRAQDIRPLLYDRKSGNGIGAWHLPGHCRSA